MNISTLLLKAKVKIADWRYALGKLIAGKEIKPLIVVPPPIALERLLEAADKRARPIFEQRFTTKTPIEEIMFIEGARLYRKHLLKEIDDAGSLKSTLASPKSTSI